MHCRPIHRHSSRSDHRPRLGQSIFLVCTRGCRPGEAGSGRACCKTSMVRHGTKFVALDAYCGAGESHPLPRETRHPIQSNRQRISACQFILGWVLTICDEIIDSRIIRRTARQSSSRSFENTKISISLIVTLIRSSREETAASTKKCITALSNLRILARREVPKKFAAGESL
jgi:hypothetical protein